MGKTVPTLFRDSNAGGGNRSARVIVLHGVLLGLVHVGELIDRVAVVRCSEDW